MRPLHIVKLNLVTPASPTLRRRNGPEHHAAVVIPDTADIEVQQEIAVHVPRRQLAVAVAAQNGASRFERWPAAGKLPFRKIIRASVKRLPGLLRRQLADADVPKPDRVG